MSIIEYPHYSEYGEEIGPVIQWLVDHDETEAADNIRKLFAREIAAQSAPLVSGTNYGARAEYPEVPCKNLA